MGATDKIFDMMPPLGLMFGNIKLNAVVGDGKIGSLCGSKSGLIPYIKENVKQFFSIRIYL